MSYDEHLISQAGGDGDPLDAIQARLAKAVDMGAWSAKHPGGGDSWVAIEKPRGFTNVTAVVAKAIDHDDAEFIANAPADVTHLLTLVRTQQATLAAVLNLANTSGRCGWRISADELRKVLRGES